MPLSHDKRHTATRLIISLVQSHYKNDCSLLGAKFLIIAFEEKDNAGADWYTLVGAENICTDGGSNLNCNAVNEYSNTLRSPIPFWFMNGDISKDDIDREFAMMAEKGVSSVVAHPRYGMSVEYLSDAYFEVFGWCIDVAKKHNMEIWVYDELNWPSGTAGLTIQRNNPEFRSKYLAVETRAVSEIDWEHFTPGLYMVAANIEGESVTKTRVLDSLDAAKSLTGNWRLFNCTLKYDWAYVDTLSYEAINKFSQVTHDEYYKRFGEEFGKTIRAVFTDEPSIYWVSVGYDDWNLPYTNDYFETFERRFGYSPVAMIPYLFYHGHEGTAFRADYWDHAGYLFNQRYHGTLSDWCKAHGVAYTGHNNNEEPLRYQIRYEGDMFGAMRRMAIPGVDHLGMATLGNWFISIIGHKICSSAAHITGKPRCMSETFGIMGWDATYANMKKVIDWQYAQGINLFIPHALFHTISGPTKRESPPSFFHQSTLWDDFGYLSQYLQRLEEMLCGGRHNCKVAILYPQSSLWASYQTDRKTSDFEHIDNFLNSLCLELIKNQIDFDLLDFQALQDAVIEDGKIKLADEVYEVLVVPSSSYTRPAEVRRLREISDAGVSTTFFFKAMEPGRQNIPNGSGSARYVRSEELESFVEILRKELNDDIQITGGGADEIMAYRREKDGQKITFLLNRSEKHRKVTAMIKDYPDAAIFDQETGAYTRLEGKRAGAKTQVELRFQPNQSMFIVSNIADAQPSKQPEGEPVPVSVENLRVEMPFNVAQLFHFTYSAEGKEPKNVDVRTQPRYIPSNWDANPPSFEGFAGVYETEIEINTDPSGIRLVLDKDYVDCEVYLNDNKISLEQCTQETSLTDLMDVTADVQGLLTRGVNRFRIISPTKLSEPIRLVGDFYTHISGTKATLEDPGSPNPLSLETNYPFFSGTMVYKAEFTLDRSFSFLRLNMDDVHDVAEVLVNGQPVGKRLWAPYILDIAGVAQQGVNQLEIRIRNNMSNLINGNARPLGIQHAPRLEGFV